MAAPLLRPVPCIHCARLSRRVFTFGDRFVCDRDECLDQVLVTLKIRVRDRARLKAALRREFEEA